jgi:hypothetical protein
VSLMLEVMCQDLARGVGHPLSLRPSGNTPSAREETAWLSRVCVDRPYPVSILREREDELLPKNWMCRVPDSVNVKDGLLEVDQGVMDLAGSAHMMVFQGRCSS